MFINRTMIFLNLPEVNFGVKGFDSPVAFPYS